MLVVGANPLVFQTWRHPFFSRFLCLTPAETHWHAIKRLFGEDFHQTDPGVPSGENHQVRPHKGYPGDLMPEISKGNNSGSLRIKAIRKNTWSVRFAFNMNPFKKNIRTFSMGLTWDPTFHPGNFW